MAQAGAAGLCWHADTACVREGDMEEAASGTGARVEAGHDAPLTLLPVGVTPGSDHFEVRAAFSRVPGGRGLRVTPA